MKVELGYYLAPRLDGENKIPIYGLRAIPLHISVRLPKDRASQMWQVEIYHAPSESYHWINQARNLVFLH